MSDEKRFSLAADDAKSLCTKLEILRDSDMDSDQCMEYEEGAWDAWSRIASVMGWVLDPDA